MTDVYDHFGVLEVNPLQRDRFINGPLRDAWLKHFPDLFDDLDYRQAVNQPRYFFYEWLTAILIYKTTGYLSLIGHYQYPSHHRKQAILHNLIHDPNVLDLMKNSQKNYHVQCPDLLVYFPDTSDYFFCEVKGVSDRIREKQKVFFTELQRVSGKRVCYVKYKLMKVNKLIERPI